VESGKRSSEAGGMKGRIVPQTIDAVAIRRHLSSKTIQELCDDYEHLVKSKRKMSWAENAVCMELSNRNSEAWFAWQFEGNPFGPVMPHRFFGLK
jgi:hypothetical protein